MSTHKESIVIVGSMAFDDLQFPRPVADPHNAAADREPRSTTWWAGPPRTLRYARPATADPRTWLRWSATISRGPTLERMRGLRRSNTEGVELVTGRTFRWSGRYHDDLVGRDTLDTQLNVFADFRPKLP